MTRTLRDYPIISRLALAHVEANAEACSDDDLRWAFDHVFTLSEFRRLVHLLPSSLRVLPSGTVLARAAAHLESKGELPPALEDELEEWFDARMAPLRRADRHFWRGVIDELRQLRAAGRLVAEGTPV